MFRLTGKNALMGLGVMLATASVALAAALAPPAVDKAVSATAGDVFEAVFFGVGDLGEQLADYRGGVVIAPNSANDAAIVAGKFAAEHPKTLEDLFAAVSTGRPAEVRDVLHRASEQLIALGAVQSVSPGIAPTCLVVFVVAAVTLWVSAWVYVDLDQASSNPPNYQMAAVPDSGGTVAADQLILQLIKSVARS